MRRFLVLVVVGGCATAPARPQPAHAVSAAHVAPVKSEEDYTAARAEFDALEPNAPERAPMRAALESYLIARVDHAVDGGHFEDAFDDLKSVLTLYDADELRGGKLSDTALAEVCGKVERAFRPRGAHQQVLTALAAEESLGAAGARDRFHTVTGWLRGAADGTDGDGRERVLEDLEQVVRLWPSPYVVAELSRIYLEPAGPNEQAQAVARRLKHGADLRELLAGGAHSTTAYDLARLYLRVADPKQALDAIDKLPDGGDPHLKSLLGAAAAPNAQPGDYIELAKYVAGQSANDRDVSARVCREAADRFPKAPEPRLCAGELAYMLDQLVVALHNFEEAVRLEPSNRQAWEALAKLYQKRLFQLVGDENLNVAELQKQLEKVEAFYAEAHQRFPDKPLDPSMAGALLEVGLGYYNVGRVDDAVKYLEQSIAMEPTARALEQLAQVRLKKGNARESASLIERAIKLPKENRVEELYWRAKLRRQLGDAFAEIDDQHGAEAARKAALADWDAFLGFPVEPDFAAEAWLEKAKLLYQLGEREDSIAAFEKAIDAVPDRGTTYADVIAFLVPRGELEEALDAYHRALGRSEVSDYLKVYCSLWITDLARRAGQPEDPLAAAYLKSTDGAKWHDDLARWATGRENDQALLARVDSPGRKAESSFYRAMRAWSQGKKDEARRLWQDVLSTDMMAFFEYDMASYYLKKGGAPSHPELKDKPATHLPPQRGAQPPDGSI